MIQRIQTLHLLFVVIFTLIALFLPPFIVYMSEGASEYHYSDLNYMDILIWAILALSLIAVFLYKNRKLQLKLVKVAVIFTLAWVIWLAVEVLQILNSIPEDAEFRPDVSILLSVLALFALLLAIKGIKKDERLVRSADRLR